jgi:hypothetical protein
MRPSLRIRSLLLALSACLVLTIAPGRASSAFLFDTGVSFDVGSAPNGVAIGDLNGDGKLDIATANAFGDDVSVLIANGDGTFQ